VILSREVLVDEVLTTLDEMMSYRRRAFCAQPLHRDISMPQFYILMTLQERDRTTMSELATLLQVSMPSASSIVDRMVDHGLIERVRDEDDRRVVHVGISDHGRALVEEISGLRRDEMQRLLLTMTDEELSDVARGVTAIRSAVSRVQQG
jgi:DNA-binding MarR family transcriptional regulator